MGVTCTVLGVRDYREAIGIIAGILTYSACDIIDIYDVETAKICEPDQAITSYGIYGLHYF